MLRHKSSQLVLPTIPGSKQIAPCSFVKVTVCSLYTLMGSPGYTYLHISVISEHCRTTKYMLAYRSRCVSVWPLEISRCFPFITNLAASCLEGTVVPSLHPPTKTKRSLWCLGPLANYHILPMDFVRIISFYDYYCGDESLFSWSFRKWAELWGDHDGNHRGGRWRTFRGNCDTDSGIVHLYTGFSAGHGYYAQLM